MSFKNIPFGARLAMYVSNEVLRRNKVLEQPELSLDSQTLLWGKFSDSYFEVRMLYSDFGRRRNVAVFIQVSRARYWAPGVKAEGVVKVVFPQDVGNRMIKSLFTMDWEPRKEAVEVGDYTHSYQPVVSFHNMM